MITAEIDLPLESLWCKLMKSIVLLIVELRHNQMLMDCTQYPQILYTVEDWTSLNSFFYIRMCGVSEVGK
jgi:hypothetical protein